MKPLYSYKAGMQLKLQIFDDTIDKAIIRSPTLGAQAKIRV